MYRLTFTDAGRDRANFAVDVEDINTKALIDAAMLNGRIRCPVARLDVEQHNDTLVISANGTPRGRIKVEELHGPDNTPPP